MITIRPAAINEIPVIQQIAMRTWPHAYAAIMSSRQLGYMLQMMYNTEVLTRQIQQEQHQFLIAYQQGEAVGFAGASAYANDLWKLHKLYVLPFRQKGGIGKTLLQAMEPLAVAAGAKGLVLQVNRHNPAIAFYQHQGFSIAETGDFAIGAGFFMHDYVMKKNWY